MNRCFPCLRRSVFRQSLVHFLYFSPLRLASSLLFSSTRFLFSGYRKINASATAVSPMIGTIQEILKIPSVTTGSNAVACEHPIRELLKYEGYQVVKAYDGMEALKALETNQIDLILLDVMMPKLNGLSALMKLRENYRIPVIILSAKTEESDKVSGLVLGADDYVEKPYNPSELIARVKAHLRRYHAWGGAAPKTDSDTLVNGGLVLDKKRRLILVEGEEVRLTATEYKILELLMGHLGQVFSAEQIYENVWKESANYTVENTVMVHIRHIREKIEIDTKKPRYVKVVWGIGYKMEKYN